VRTQIPLVHLVNYAYDYVRQTYSPFSERWKTRTSEWDKQQFQTVTPSCSSTWCERWCQRWRRWLRKYTSLRVLPYNNVRYNNSKHSRSENLLKVPNVLPSEWKLAEVTAIYNKKDGYRQLNMRQFRSAHFGLPWVHPWDNRGKCHMDEKRIQCLSNVSQHVPSTVSSTVSQ